MQIRLDLSAAAVPAQIIQVAELPITFSGKYMRRLLKDMLTQTPIGDTSAVSNPLCIPLLQQTVAAALRQAPHPLLGDERRHHGKARQAG